MNTLASTLRSTLLRTAVFQFSTILVWLLLVSPQGQELSRISSEQSLSLPHALTLGCIPLLFALATALIASFGWKMASCETEVPEAQSIGRGMRLLATIINCLPMPMLLFSTVAWHNAYLLYFFIGLLLVTAVAIFMRQRQRLLMLFCVSALVLSGCYALVAYPDAASWVGTIGVTVVALLAWSWLLSLAMVAVPYAFLRTDAQRLAYGTAIVAVGVLVLLKLPSITPAPEPKGVYLDEPKKGWYPDYSPAQAYFLDWIEARLPHFSNDGPVPIYLVAAEGGGLRAAIWTAALLNAFDQGTEGKFFRHLFALSGVSGGAVGMTYYAECRMRDRTNPDCGSSPLRRDFLAPAVARLLLVEPFRMVPYLNSKLLPRDRVFEGELSRSLANGTKEDRMGLPMNTVFRVDQAAESPVMVINTTDAYNGRRVYFSNINLQIEEAVHAHFGIDAPNSVPLSFAIHTSARFPLISPPAVYGGWLLVDGGYRENIGLPELEVLLDSIRRVVSFAETSIKELEPIYQDYNLSEKEVQETARILLRHHQRARRLLPVLRRIQVHIIAITNNTYTNSAPFEYPEQRGSSGIANSGPMDDFFAPVSAILASRDSRTRDAIQRLDTELKKPAEDEAALCRRMLTKEAVRLGKSGTSKYLTARPFHSEETTIPCEVSSPRHQLYEYSLRRALEDKMPQLKMPPLGWVLSRRAYDDIQDAVSSNSSANVSLADDFRSTGWFVQLVGNLCGGAGTGDIIGTVSFDNNGEYDCHIPNFQTGSKSVK